MPEKKKRGRPKFETPVITSEPQFSIILKIGSELYTSTGESALLALQNLPKPDPSHMMAKGVLTISQGTKKKELLMLPLQLKRLFYPKREFQIITAKRLSAYMK